MNRNAHTSDPRHHLKRFLILALLAVTMLQFISLAAATDNDFMGRWPMDEGSGQVVGDAEGPHDGWRGYDSSVEPYDPAWTTDDSGNYALEFSGHEEFVTIDHDPDMWLDTVTASAYIYPRSYGDDEGFAQTIFTKNREFKMGIFEDGQFVAAVRSDDCNPWCNVDEDGFGGWVPSGFIVELDEWTEVAFTWDGSEFRFFKNGEHMSTVVPDTGDGPIEDHALDLNIGAKCVDPDSETCDQYTHGYSYFDGIINSFRIYDEAIPDEDLTGSAPETEDNYDDDGWKDTPQDIEIWCTDDDCEQIHWRIEDDNGNILEPDDSSYEVVYDTSTPVTVGEDHDGELYLVYRGEDEDGNQEDWNSQRVRIDKVDPSVSVDHSPGSPSADDDVTIDASASDSHSGIDRIEIYVDGTHEETCSSNTCQHTVDSSETDPGETVPYTAVAYDLAGNNQDADGSFTVEADVSTQITGPDEDDWYNEEIPVSVDDENADSCYYQVNGDGWTTRTCGSGFTVSVGSDETCSTEGSDACLVEVRADDEYDNTVTDDATFNIDYTAPTSSLDDTDEWYEDDFTLVDEVTDSDTGGSGIDYCEYQTNDGGDGWTGWTDRDCDQVSVSVGEDSINECTTEGENECGIRIRAVDNAGNIGDAVEEYYNIGYSEIEVTVHYDDNQWKNQTQPIDITCDAGGLQCEEITWEIQDENGQTITGPETEPYEDPNTVPVGDDQDEQGELTLWAEGEAEDGRTGEDQALVYIDMTNPHIEITGPDEENDWFNDDFTVDVIDEDDISGINETTCEYTIYDDGIETNSDTRDCNTDNAFTVTVGDDPTNDCTTTGENTCTVETRVQDNAGNTGTHTAQFNIDLSDPEIDCNEEDGCHRPEPVAIENPITFDPDTFDPYSGINHTQICRNADCQRPYCEYPGDDSCTYTTSFSEDYPYGPKEYCIYTEDNVGNNNIQCDNHFTLLAGLGDPCDLDDHCILGTCEQNICEYDEIPPPELHFR